MISFESACWHPYTSQNDLKYVCRSWEGMVSIPHFYADKKISGKSKHLICFIQHDLRVVGYSLGSYFCVINIYGPLNNTC